MASLRTDIAFNLAGRIYTAAVAFFFVPVYIKLLGIEAFGLVGFVNSLLAMAAMFDVGLSTTINREMARMANRGAAGTMRDLVRTMEVPYWGLAVAICGVIYTTAPWISARWINSTELSHADVQRAIMLGGAFIALQMPLGLYTGGLLGLQHQVLWNGIQASATTIRHVGAVLLLWLVWRTIEAFLIWQAVVSAIQVAMTMFALWNRLPHEQKRPRIRLHLLAQCWRYATGMTSLTLLSALVLQMDKLMLSALVSLSSLGYYTAASVVARNISIVVTPVFSAAFPRFTQIIQEQDHEALRQLFHRYSQLITLLVVPISVVIALFPWEVLYLWTHDRNVAANGAAVLPVLITASALTGLGDVPYTVALAAGKIKFMVLVYLFGLILLTPTMYVLIIYLGELGAAIALLLFWLGSLIIQTPIVLRPLLPGATRRWWFNGVTIPLSASVLATASLRLALPFESEEPIRLAAMLTMALTVAAGSCAVASDWLRGLVVRSLRIPANFG